MTRLLLILITAAAVLSCTGIDRLNAKHKTDAQLKLRLSQLERELSGYVASDVSEHDVSMLHTERDAIERELLHRYEQGDRNAYLPQFGH